MPTEKECLLEICTNYDRNNDDEKHKECGWKQLCSIKDPEQFDYKITNIDFDTNHGLRGRYKDNKGEYSNWCKPIFFKTS